MTTGRTDELGDLVMATAHALRRRYAGSTAAWGVTPAQARALRTVIAEGGPRLSELADRLHIAPRSATEVVDALEERGLVRRVPDPADRRAVCVQATDDGGRMRELIEADRGAVAREYFATLSADDRADLARILATLVDP